MKEEIKFGAYRIDATAYDNTGAYNMLKTIMERQEKLTVQFFTDKWNYACAWVESKTIKAFKFRLSEDSLAWLIEYLNTGESCGEVNPLQVEPEQEGEEDFQVEFLKLHVIEKMPLQFIPLFRTSGEYIHAESKRKYGLIIFKVQRTEELLQFLKQNEVIF